MGLLPALLKLPVLSAEVLQLMDGWGNWLVGSLHAPSCAAANVGPAARHEEGLQRRPVGGENEVATLRSPRVSGPGVEPLIVALAAAISFIAEPMLCVTIVAVAPRRVNDPVERLCTLKGAVGRTNYIVILLFYVYCRLLGR
jgi:hypothetical protein